MIADRARRRPDDGVHRPVAAAAQPGQGHAGRAAVPRLRRQRAPGASAGKPSSSSRASCARTARRCRSARCRLHVRQRAARAPLRHPRRLRLALPARAGRRIRTGAACWATAAPVDDRGRHAHVARAAREIHHLEPAEHAAAAAAGGRAGSRGERAQGQAVDGSGTARTASREPGLRRRAIATSIRSASRWRTSTPSGSGATSTREGLAIDAAGVLADGTKVDGPVALRKALLARPDVFVGTVTEKLLIYALGRGLEPVDMPVVRSVVRNAAAQNYAMHSIVLGIVRSAPFQMRTKLTDTGHRAGVDRPAPSAREGVADVRHEEAPASPDVSPRRPGRVGRDAVSGRDGSGAVGAGRQAPVPVRRDLRSERHLPAAVASGHDRQRLRVQADHAAARAVPQPPGDHQRDEGARRQPRHGRRAHGRQRRVAERHRPGHQAGEVRGRVEEEHRSVHRRQGGRGHAAAIARGGHRGHGDVRRRVRRLSRACSSTPSRGATTRARCPWPSTRA